MKPVVFLKYRRALVVLALAFLSLLLPAHGAFAATFTVTNDSGAGSLRQAVLDSNTTAGSDTNCLQFVIQLAEDDYISFGYHD